MESIGELLILAEQEADLTPPYADVPSGDVGLRPDMTHKFAHKSLAKAHHFLIALAFGVEVGPSFGTAHGQGGEAVLEDLLEG